MMCRWLGLLGWCMTLSSLWLIPGYGLYLYFTTEGTRQQRLAAISSAKEAPALPKSVSKVRARKCIV